MVICSFEINNELFVQRRFNNSQKSKEYLKRFPTAKEAKDFLEKFELPENAFEFVSQFENVETAKMAETLHNVGVSTTQIKNFFTKSQFIQSIDLIYDSARNEDLWSFFEKYQSPLKRIILIIKRGEEYLLSTKSRDMSSDKTNASILSQIIQQIQLEHSNESENLHEPNEDEKNDIIDGKYFDRLCICSYSLNDFKLVQNGFNGNEKSFENFMSKFSSNEEASLFYEQFDSAQTAVQFLSLFETTPKAILFLAKFKNGTLALEFIQKFSDLGQAEKSLKEISSFKNITVSSLKHFGLSEKQISFFQTKFNEIRSLRLLYDSRFKKGISFLSSSWINNSPVIIILSKGNHLLLSLAYRSQCYESSTNSTVQVAQTKALLFEIKENRNTFLLSFDGENMNQVNPENCVIQNSDDSSILSLKIELSNNRFFVSNKFENYFQNGKDSLDDKPMNVSIFIFEYDILKYIETHFENSENVKLFVSKFKDLKKAKIFLDSFSSFETAENEYNKYPDVIYINGFEHLIEMGMSSKQISEMYKKICVSSISPLYDSNTNAKSIKEFHSKINSEKNTLIIAKKGNTYLCGIASRCHFSKCHNSIETKIFLMTTKLQMFTPKSSESKLSFSKIQEGISLGNFASNIRFFIDPLYIEVNARRGYTPMNLFAAALGCDPNSRTSVERIIAFSCETNEVEQLEKLFGGKSALKNYLDKFLSHADAMLFLSKFHSLEKAVQLFSKNCSQKEPEYLEALEALKMDKNRIEKLHKELGFNDLHVLYDTSKDAQTSSEYHKKVDGKEQTLTVAIKGDNYIGSIVYSNSNPFCEFEDKKETIFVITPSSERFIEANDTIHISGDNGLQALFDPLSIEYSFGEQHRFKDESFGTLFGLDRIDSSKFRGTVDRLVVFSFDLKSPFEELHCRKGHQMQLLTTDKLTNRLGHKYSGLICDRCRVHIPITSRTLCFHCQQCEYDLCIGCSCASHQHVQVSDDDSDSYNDDDD